MSQPGLKRWQLFLIFSLVAIFTYANQLLYRYQVPPGGDAIGHNQIVTEILAGQYSGPLSYHFVWHFIVAAVSKVTNVLSITVMAWLGPALWVSGVVALYYFNRRYFGPIAGVTVLLLMGFFSRQPLQTLYDGGFPNVLASMTVLPLVFMVLESVWTTKRKILMTLVFVASLVLLFFSHHLTALYALAILAIYLSILLLLWLHRRGWHWLSVLLLAPAIYVGLAALAQLFFRFNITSSKVLVSLFLKVDWQWPFFHLTGQLDNPNALLDITSYPNTIGESVVWLSFGGAIVALLYFVKGSGSPKGRGALLLLVWATLLLAGSQAAALGFPVRLTRELAVPLALLGGVFFQAVWDFSRARRIPTFLPLLVTLLGLSLGYQTLIDRTKAALAPDPLVYHQRVDSEMTSYINQYLPKGSTIAVFQDNIYLPLFVRDRTVLSQISEPNKLKITDPSKIATVLPEVNYVYFEYRPNQPMTWKNNRANLKSYLNSKSVSLVQKKAQPEKEIYLFLVNKLPVTGSFRK